MKIFLIIAGVFVFLCFILSWIGRRNHDKNKLARFIDEAKTYLGDIQKAQALPVVEVPNFQLQQKEFAILHQTNVPLHAFVPPPIPRANVILQTSGLMLTDAPKRQRGPDQPPVIAIGDLSLTNQRLVFASDRLTLVIALDRVVSFYASFAGLRINTMDSAAPYFWRVANSLVWEIMLKWMIQGQVTDPKLPPGARLTLNVTGSGTDKRVEFSMTSETDAA